MSRWISGLLALSGQNATCLTLLFLLTSLFQQTAQPQSLQNLQGTFQNPPADARPIMRWWWFGPAVTKPELQTELETMQKAGIGGVEIQPVYPLMLDDPAKGIRNLKYLSPDFLDAVTFANQTAQSLGMRVDITLGSGWPYGGPKTTIALAAGRLKVISLPVTGASIAPPKLEEGESFIAAFLVNGSPKSFDASSAKQIDPAATTIPTSASAQTALYFLSSHTRQAVKRAAFGAEGFVLDHFSRAAIDEHIADVATPLIHAFGDHPPYSVFSDSLEVYGSDWTPNLPAEFQKRRGYDLIPHLPELLAGGTPQADAIRHDWGLTLSDLIRENYLTPLTEFAEAHHTRFRSQTYGVPAVTLADESIPNLPEGEGPQWRQFSFTRWASSASHLYGRNVTSAETWTWLHSPAFRATPLDMKAEADRMFLLGVNQIVGHGYPYSPPAAGEPGWSLYAAAVFNSHNPWFPLMPDIDAYLQRISWLLRQGKPANDVAILLPEDDAQSAFTPGHVSVTDEMKRLITPQLMSTILDAGYNIDYIDAATINKFDTIPYPILILPAVQRIPLETYKKIEKYAATGKLIAIRSLPSLAPGLKQQQDSQQIAALSNQLFTTSNHHGVFIHSITDLPQILHQALPPDIAATGQTEGFGFLHRRLSDTDIYFVANTSNQPIEGAIQFRSTFSHVESWSPDTGALLVTSSNSSEHPIALKLASYESRVFVLTNKSDLAQTAEAPHTNRERQLADLSTDWQIQFPPTEPHPLPSLTSWTDLPSQQYFSGEATYTRSFTLDHNIDSVLSQGGRILIDFGVGTPIPDNRPPNASGMHALLDPPIREAAIVEINGHRAASLWHPPYRIDVTALIHPGQNQIQVHVFNTAINELAGQPSRDYTALNAKYGKRFDPQDMDNLKPIPSGLFGPIHLIEQSK
jgi:hypothetical protein